MMPLLNTHPQWVRLLWVQIADERVHLCRAAVEIRAALGRDDCGDYRLIASVARARLLAAQQTISEALADLEAYEGWLEANQFLAECPIK